MADNIQIEILEDGSLKIITDKVSNPNHAGAESLIRELTTGMGGEATRVRRGHVHEHTHDGVTHTH
jgi:hypothetical protein